jgi:hypothetical protein
MEWYGIGQTVEYPAGQPNNGDYETKAEGSPRSRGRVRRMPRGMPRGVRLSRLRADPPQPAATVMVKRTRRGGGPAQASSAQRSMRCPLPSRSCTIPPSASKVKSNRPMRSTRKPASGLPTMLWPRNTTSVPPSGRGLNWIGPVRVSVTVVPVLPFVNVPLPAGLLHRPAPASRGSDARVRRASVPGYVATPLRDSTSLTPLANRTATKGV